MRPDLVLSDVMPPGRDGLALLGDLRSDPVPDDYVVKPFRPAELIARTRVHLELSSFREALPAAAPPARPSAC
ncbi:response regulator transcription factor [Saccharothrix sp. 6-C]|uniref:response regulator transcription factor n=1 Tax=Saccharothrix sp. 6-C TaxID=2781735 RepID=UPI0019178249|nr:response regulator transcription factor [Saccharothrix sp. 6-C]QQQ79978.1 response regulator transcription factor [Saccharothrix sp. 6-C]